MAPATALQHGLSIANGPAFAVKETVEAAVAAEEAGWDGVFVSDSFEFGYSDPWTLLAAIAARTERVRLGTWISGVAQQPPWRLAQQLATLDQLSNGRLLLGAGLGVRQDYEKFGEPYDAQALARRYDEALEIIVGLWRGEPFSFDGAFFTVDGAVLPVVPVQQPRIPILIAGWWPSKPPFRRAARWDGIMPYWPALLGGAAGPEGQQPTGASVDQELRALVAYYHEVADSPGEIVLPRERHDPDFDALCHELGATWLLTAYVVDIDGIRQGPPPGPPT